VIDIVKKIVPQIVAQHAKHEKDGDEKEQIRVEL